MQLISKFNKGIRFLLLILLEYAYFSICIFHICIWVVPLKNKKGMTIVNVFQKFLDSMKLHSKRKPNKIWVNKCSEFYNSSFKKG